MDKPSSGKPPQGLRDEEAGAADAETLPDAELLAQCRVDTFRSGGKGGQHQNKTESGVRLTHRPSGIVVTARDSRSQARNREIALGRLRSRLTEAASEPKTRIATRVPLKERRKRVEEKKRKSKVKSLRRKPEPDDL